MSDAIRIQGNDAASFAVSADAAQSGPLSAGVYDVSCDVDVYVKVAKTADDVTVDSGYKIFAGNIVPVNIPDAHRLGAIAGEAGTLRYHKVG